VPRSRATVLPMSVSPGMRPDEKALLTLARDGDQDAFGELAGAHRAELRAHCYRMLGSVHDAEDALQEALLRAWRSLSGFEGRSSVRSWLYAIATNAALDVARQRARRELPVGFGPSGSSGMDSTQADSLWLEPYPDQWLADDRASSPEARYEQRESVELAFVIAMQYLPPLQRAVLLLREVAGFPTAEISRQLGASAAAVNSALQRARAAARDRLPDGSQQATLRQVGDQRTRALVRRYADALERGDADTLISMLTDDATWSMPPEPAWYRGHEAVREFLLGGPLCVRWRHRAARANGQLAVGCYLYHEALGRYAAWCIDVLTLDGDKIAAVTAFLAAEAAAPGRSDGQLAGPELFSRFGLPAELGPAADDGICRLEPSDLAI
jgi:RNA polymerase sigma-70 factor, ECF subfamily